MTPETILGLEDDDFAKLVNEDMRGQVPTSVSKLLRHPEVVQRWYDVLVATQKSVEGQMGAAEAEIHAAELEAQRNPSLMDEYTNRLIEHERWRASSLRFKSGLDTTMGEAKRLIRKANNESMLSRYQRDNNRYYQAIREHLKVCPLHDESLALLLAEVSRPLAERRDAP